MARRNTCIERERSCSPAIERHGAQQRTETLAAAGRQTLLHNGQISLSRQSP